MANAIRLPDYLTAAGFDAALIQTLTPLFRVRDYQKGEILLPQGENTNVICLILQGIVRGFYLDAAGAEITKCFSQTGDWCCIYNLLDDGPSEYGIEALEDCQVAQIGVPALRQALADAPVLRDLYDKLLRQAFVRSDEKGLALQRLPAKERYREFVARYPDLVKRVRQEHIASYIGVTPSSLSRLKREL
jgi:CRP-like cAMP-binding protein